MYFEDLTPYAYLASPPYSPNFLQGEPWPRLPLLNIGWLEPSHSYTRGPVSSQVTEALHTWREKYPVHETRGFHVCGFCVMSGAADEYAAEFRRASYELRIIGQGCVYAAPFLLPHYISVHEYQPPSAFISAVRPLHPSCP